MFDQFDCGDLKSSGFGIIKIVHILLNRIK